MSVDTRNHHYHTQSIGICLQRFREGNGKERATVKRYSEEGGWPSRPFKDKQQSIVRSDSAMLGPCLQGYHEVNLRIIIYDHTAASALVFIRGIVTSH